MQVGNTSILPGDFFQFVVCVIVYRLGISSDLYLLYICDKLISFGLTQIHRDGYRTFTRISPTPNSFLRFDYLKIYIISEIPLDHEIPFRTAHKNKVYEYVINEN